MPTQMAQLGMPVEGWLDMLGERLAPNLVPTAPGPFSTQGMRSAAIVVNS